MRAPSIFLLVILTLTRCCSALQSPTFNYSSFSRLSSIPSVLDVAVVRNSSRPSFGELLILTSVHLIYVCMRECERERERAHVPASSQTALHRD